MKYSSRFDGDKDFGTSISIRLVLNCDVGLG